LHEGLTTVWQPEGVSLQIAPEDQRTEGMLSRAHRSWRNFVVRHGWRAYALPVLLVVTIAALSTTKSPTVRRTLEHAVGVNTAQNTPPVAASTGQLMSDQPGAGAMNEALASDALPPGPGYTKEGLGTYSTIPGTSGVIGTGANLYKFSIEVENGLAGVDLNAFANTVMATLSDPHSWTADHKVSLERVDRGPVDFHVTLVSSMTVRSLCGYDIPVETSCFAADHDNRVVLNVARWVRGDAAYIADLANYHRYMINHEVGHALGHGHIFECLPNGLAPVMMQQTITLKSHSGPMCEANPWPFP